MSYQSLGKVNAESAATVRTAKAQQVQSIMGDLANGVITPAQAEAQLAEHRQHALLLSHAIANSDSKDAVAAGEAASLVDDIDAAMAAAPVPLNSAAVVDQSLAGARARAKPL